MSLANSWSVAMLKCNDKWEITVEIGIPKKALVKTPPLHLPVCTRLHFPPSKSNVLQDVTQPSHVSNRLCT